MHSDLEILRDLRQHFIKNFDRAKDWSRHASPHGGCLFVFILQKYNTRIFETSDPLLPHLRTINIFPPHFWRQMHSPEYCTSLLQTLERKIAELEEMECAPVENPKIPHELIGSSFETTNS